MSFLDALETGRPMRRKSWWQHMPGGPGDRWLVMTSDGEWTWRDGSPANPPWRAELFSEDWEVLL